ncbi:hypothetical protein [Rufibacter ruber]|uniref:hypothetical protein n=1 Tax=Rufibacter ruber TaxID=1783499 RepID=UPI0008372479|nr:hypothetical protein [Rufibacter ruber]
MDHTQMNFTQRMVAVMRFFRPWVTTIERTETKYRAAAELKENEFWVYASKFDPVDFEVPREARETREWLEYWQPYVTIVDSYILYEFKTYWYLCQVDKSKFDPDEVDEEVRDWMSPYRDDEFLWVNDKFEYWDQANR